MTLQISDRVRYRCPWHFLRREYALTAVNGNGLFDPKDHGIAPDESRCTALYRGFICDYSVHREQLWLDRLSVYQDTLEPRLFGVAPRHNEGWGFAEIQLRPGHYALVCAATAVVVSEGRVAETSISVGGLNSNPYRAASAEAFTLGRDILTDTWITEAARIAVDGSPWAARADQHASAEYRQAMAIIVVRDALRSAARRAQFAPRKGHG